MAIVEAWDEFLQVIAMRARIVGTSGEGWAEDTFRSDYVVALTKTGVPLERIWPGYLYPKASGSGARVDVFVAAVEREVTEPGEYMEIQCCNGVRMESRQKRLGMLVGDIWKVRGYVDHNWNTYLLIITDEDFRSFLGSVGFPEPLQHRKLSTRVALGEMAIPKSSVRLSPEALEELPADLKEKKARYFSFTWLCRRHVMIGDLNLALVEIERLGLG